MRYFVILYFGLTFISCTNKNAEIPISAQKKETVSNANKVKENSFSDTVNSTVIKKNTITEKFVKKNLKNKGIDYLKDQDFSEMGHLNIVKESQKYTQTNNFQIAGDSIRFTSKSIVSESSGVGCSGNSTSIVFKIKNTNQTTFEYKDLDLKMLNFEYIINGGLYYATGKDPESGYIKGRIVEGQWEVEIDLKIIKMDQNIKDQEGILVPIKMKEIFNRS